MADKEYIEKRAALNAICKACDRRHPDDKENCPQKFAGCMEFYNVFELPATDVEPVRHGKWVSCITFGRIYTGCSECKAPIPDHSQLDCMENSDSLYCYSCGAKMDGGVTDAAD